MTNTTKITVYYYDPTATRIVRTGAYATRAAADRAMGRACAKGQPSAIAGTRTSADAPTVHH